MFSDRDNDGTFNGSDAGIAGITVQLFDENNLAAALATTTTAIDRTYLFNVDLGEGAYRIVAAPAASLLDGMESAGLLGGTVNNRSDSNAIQNIVVTADAGDLLADGYNFAEIQASRLQGLVWEDSNNNGSVDFGEQAIPGVAVDSRGQTTAARRWI